MEHAHADACADERTGHSRARPSERPSGREGRTRLKTKKNPDGHLHDALPQSVEVTSPDLLVAQIERCRSSRSCRIPRSPRPRSSPARGSPICFVRQVLLEMAQAIIALVHRIWRRTSFHKCSSGPLRTLGRATRNALVRPRSAATNHDGGPDDHDGPG